MSPPSPDSADTIVGDALNLPPAEREAHLVAACRDNTALLDEVRTLLATHEESVMKREVPPQLASHNGAVRPVADNYSEPSFENESTLLARFEVIT